ncbi:MAG: response regulator, partial [Dissulfurimicrobium sp.]
VVTLDVDMPVMDGLTAIKHIMIKMPTPVVMVSGLAGHGRVTFDALRLGAVDFFPKPSGTISLDIHSRADELSRVVVRAARMNPMAIKRVRFQTMKAAKTAVVRDVNPPLGLAIVVAGRGFLGPFMRLLVNLRRSLPISIICIQDVSCEVIESYSKELDSIVRWDVRLAKGGLCLKTGSCLVASKDSPPWIEADDSGGFKIANGPPGNAQQLFEQAVALTAGCCLAVVMGEPEHPAGDGPEKIKAGGGEVIFFNPNLTEGRLGDAMARAGREVISDERELLARIDAFGRRLLFGSICKSRAISDQDDLLIRD